jgi:hypothetical protein
MWPRLFLGAVKVYMPYRVCLHEYVSVCSSNRLKNEKKKEEKRKEKFPQNMLHELSVASIDPFLFLVYGYTFRILASVMKRGQSSTIVSLTGTH